MKDIVLESTMYEKPKKGISMFGEHLITIIGEQTVKLTNGKTVDQYIYNIDGYTPENGKPFVSLKANIILMGGEK